MPPHQHCLVCLGRRYDDLERTDAGPSSAPASAHAFPKEQRIRRRQRLSQYFYSGLAAAAIVLTLPAGIAATAPFAHTEDVLSIEPVEHRSGSPSSLGFLFRKRKTKKRQSPYGANQDLSFSVHATPPRTCQPMNITFDPRMGTPPFTIFVGFSTWYPYTVSLPSTYADASLPTWFYQFDVPVFRPVVTGSTATPSSVVVVSDSTGNLMNSSSFQTVIEDDISCAEVSGKLDFSFYNDPPSITACDPVSFYWNFAAPQIGWKDPLDLFILRELAPPVHIAVTNSSAKTLNYTVALAPGSNLMFLMTDNGGNGGVSGQNTVGGSEYIGQACLSQAATSMVPIAIPSPTTVLNSATMADYTAIVSSTVTSNGVVSTSTAIQTYRNGSLSSASTLGKGSIAGVAVGVLLGATVLAAVVSWCMWRKRNGSRNLRWDVPRSAEEHLSKLNPSGPIDEGFLRNQRKAMGRSGSGVQMLSATSPSSESNDGREQQNRRIVFETSPENSFVDTPQDEDASPLRTRNSPPWNNSSSLRYGNVGPGLTQYQEVYNEGNSPLSGGGLAMARRLSETDSIVSNPFGNSHAVTTPRNMRQPFTDYIGGGGGGAGAETEGESLAMTDTRYQSSARMYSDLSNASPYETEQRFGSRGSLPRSANPTYVQHSDGGLLMDDSLEEEDLGDHIELPPQYDAVPRRVRPASRPAMSRPNNAEEAETDLARVEVLRRASNEEIGDADESEFWKSPSSSHRPLS
ncbi:hypothetical protein CBS101457_001089 [Exobasidium rhododendri]|nr:hypothetical protein CBS101457_001089 [Exobasidium rhododendri]